MRALLLLVGLIAALSSPVLSQSRGDSAAMQAALALGGRYEGPIDGDWGPASARAAQGVDRSGLLGELAHEWTAAGWRPVRGPDQGPGALAPMGLLRRDSGGEGVEYITPGGDLSLAFIRRDGTGTMSLHGWLERSAASAVTRTDEPGRLVSRGRLPDGTRVHLASYFRSELDARTVVVRWRAGEARRARLLTASIAPGAATLPAVPAGIGHAPSVAGAPLASLVPPPRPGSLAAAQAIPEPAPAAIRPEPRSGAVEDALREVLAEAPEPARPEGRDGRPGEIAREDAGEDTVIEVAAPVSEIEEAEEEAPAGRAGVAAMPGPDPGTVIGTGTGFFVSPDRLITNAHVVAPCESMTTASGIPVRLLAVDSERDLALMQSKEAAASWMPLGADETPLLGAPVRVLGFPFGGAYHDGVSVTSGLVSARGASWVGAERLMISAPIQPGNSGGPVLSTGGEVIGVVTSRLNSADGTSFSELPQNMAYAVPTAALRDFLQDAEAEPAAAEPLDMEEGIPRHAERAVVHLLCLS